MKLILTLMMLMIPMISQAQWIAEAGIFAATFDEGTEPSYRIRAGKDGLYAWAGYDESRAKILGQPIADVEVLGVGLGVTHSWGKFSGFLEAGYGFVSKDVNDFVEREVSYSYLVGRHAVGERRIPVDHCYGWECYGHDYDLDDAPMARIGVEYAVRKHIKVSASYRWMQADEYIAVYDEYRRANDLGWWEETNSRDLGAMEIGIFFTY